MTCWCWCWWYGGSYTAVLAALTLNGPAFEYVALFRRLVPLPISRPLRRIVTTDNKPAYTQTKDYKAQISPRARLGRASWLHSFLHTTRIMFFCSISGEPPQDPVVSQKSGHVYERRLILKYINENGTDPITGAQLEESDLIPIKASTSNEHFFSLC